MGMNLDQALGIHAHTLNFRVERARILAGNLANVDTPGYLARDYNFKTAMADIVRRLERPGSDRFAAGSGGGSELLYRVPMQPATDGNTSELGAEQARFAANAMDFQTSLTFLNMKLSGLKAAIEG